MRKMTVTVAATIGAATLLVACTSETDSTGGSGSGSTSDVAVAASKALDEKIAAASQLDIQALAKSAPSGKFISMVTCPLPSCQGIEQGVKEAADAIGWTVNVVDGGLTPDTFTSAMTTVAKDPGVGVLAPGILPNSAIQDQLDTLKAKGVPFVAFSSASPIGDGMVVNIGAENVAFSAETMADWVVSDSDGKASSVLVYDKSFPLMQVANDAFAAEVKKLCPDCKTDELATNFTTGIGKAVPEEVVSYLQQNPDTGYIVFQLGNATAGVGPAISAAGLGDRVKIVSRFADPANFASIKSGLEAMGVTQETFEAGWRGVDAIARVLTGSDVVATPLGTQAVVTKDSLPSDLDQPYAVENYKAPFLEAWGVEE